MIDVYWFEQTLADVPRTNDWLSARERDRLSNLRFVKRRADWRLGRWTAKNAVAAYLLYPSRRFQDIEIWPSSSGAPTVFIANRRSAFEISLTHRAGRAACAVATSQIPIGCDLELVEPRSSNFIDDYFVAEERQILMRVGQDNRDWFAALLWSAKESALKALQIGLRLDTRCLTVKLNSSLETLIDTSLSGPRNWLPLEIRCTNERTLHGWWQLNGVFVRTVVAVHAPAPPIRLDNSQGIPQVEHLTRYVADDGIKMVHSNH